MQDFAFKKIDLEIFSIFFNQNKIMKTASHLEKREKYCRVFSFTYIFRLFRNYLKIVDITTCFTQGTVNKIVVERPKRRYRMRMILLVLIIKLSSLAYPRSRRGGRRRLSSIVA